MLPTAGLEKIEKKRLKPLKNSGWILASRIEKRVETFSRELKKRLLSSSSLVRWLFKPS